MRIIRIRKIFIWSLICVLILSTPALATRKKKRKYTGVSCRAAVFINNSTGKRLYQKNTARRVLPASTAKVMTALIVFEKLPLDQYVTVPIEATYTQPSKINSRPGERYRVRDLLYAILLNSANDASVVLAQAVAGSEYKFVQLMNARAKSLGAQQTRFANSHGLPTKIGTQYTTAYDMYLIFKQALKYDFFRDTVRMQYKTIRSFDGRLIGLRSHNKILFSKWKKKIYGKTGYTRAAQQCFVGAVESGGQTYIISVFGCTNRWGDIRHIISRYAGIAL